MPLHGARAFGGTMATSAGPSALSGVVRVRVDEYEKLMGSMLEEAESRIAVAVAEKNAVLGEMEVLREQLNEAERRLETADTAFDLWKQSLVDAAADELAEETSKCRAQLVEKDRMIQTQRETIDQLHFHVENGGRPLSNSNPESNARDALTTRRAGLHDSLESDTPLERQSGPSNSAIQGLHPYDPSTPLQSPNGGNNKTHRRNKSRSSAAPVAESPAPDDALIKETKEEAAAKMRDATKRGLQGVQAVGNANVDGSADLPKEESAWFWPFA